MFSSFARTHTFPFPRRAPRFWGEMGEMMLLYYLAVLAFAACGLAVLVAAAWRLLAAAWGRRWQLCECILGASDCYLLPDSYCAAAIGSVLYRRCSEVPPIMQVDEICHARERWSFPQAKG